MGGYKWKHILSLLTLTTVEKATPYAPFVTPYLGEYT